MTECTNDRGPTGVERAIELYGRPCERQVTIAVAQESLDYWRGAEDGRTAEVMLLVRRKSGRYLLHTKPFYPPGAYRVMTGGIHPGEDLAEAVAREASEETGLTLQIERFLAILRQRYLHGDEWYCFATYIFELSELGGELCPQDEGERISGFREVTVQGLLATAEELEALPGRWVDWGTVRAAAHRLAVELLEKGSAQ